MSDFGNSLTRKRSGAPPSACSGRWTTRVLKTYRDTVDLATM
jgi:hypothetical protein